MSEMSDFCSPFLCGTNFFGHTLPPQDTALTTNSHRQRTLRVQFSLRNENLTWSLQPTPTVNERCEVTSQIHLSLRNDTYNQLPPSTNVARIQFSLRKENLTWTYNQLPRLTFVASLGNPAMSPFPPSYNHHPRRTFVASAYPPRKIVKDSSMRFPRKC
jgi:hypothetical protein